MKPNVYFDCTNVELHKNSDCKYKKHSIKTDRGKMFVLLRKCKCMEYDNRVNETMGNSVSLKPSDGKSVHFSDSCEWDRTKLRRGDSETMYRLEMYCSCPK